ncbi:MAG: aminoglycoside phosphotransferase family protein [Rhodospirillaceae bacterium]|nr:aminoglycoside phosphotransferase family protein [Rhodospirillaceae bacterium]
MSAAALHTDLSPAARRLVGAPIERCQCVGGGRNARVWRIVTATGAYALKQYPAAAEDQRDRLGAEREALQWMANAGIDAVARFIAANEEKRLALLSWMDGAVPSEIGERDIEQAAAFLAALRKAHAVTPYPSRRLASEACLSGAEIERQLRVRHARLRTLGGESELQAFLDGAFAPALERHVSAARRFRGYEAELAPEARLPVPSDFGFHNTLRNAEGRLAFLDFEYFGWDDPVKLTADFLLHPATPLSASLREKLRARLLHIYEDDDGFAVRIDAYLPLFALRWALILLNDFRPDIWGRRVLAETGADWSRVKARQLARARAMLNTVPT